MALNLQLAQTVAVGPFNPYIITPNWLVRWNVLREQDVNIRVAPLIDGAAFRFDRLEWQVDPRRLIVSSETLNDNQGHNTGYYVCQVLSLLPHTPVQAVGHNFHFASSLDDWGSRPLPMLGQHSLEDLEQAEEVRWTGLFQREQVRVQMTIGRSHKEIVVLFNFHHKTDPQAIEPAQEAARLFLSDYESSKKMLRQLLSQEVTDA